MLKKLIIWQVSKIPLSLSTYILTPNIMQIRHASNLYGFESLLITVGGVVNQDQNLAELFGSEAANDVR